MLHSPGQFVEKASQSLRTQAQMEFHSFSLRHVRRRKYFTARKRASVSECAAASRSLFKREPNEVGLV